jgi:hypothetical protein
VPRDVRAIASPSRQALNPPLFSSCRVRQGRERRANVIDDALDKIEIVAFAHDPDDWFGARRADDKAAAFAKLLTAILDGARDTRVHQRLSGLESHIPQDLRHRIESTADLALGGCGDRVDSLRLLECIHVSLRNFIDTIFWGEIVE